MLKSLPLEIESHHKSPTLPPDQPLIVIEPSKSWAAVNYRDLWIFRELLYFLIWRDVKVRYKQAVLGALWVVMQPFITTLVFTVFLGYLARVPSDGIPYPLFAFAALLPWTFFANAVTNSGSSLVGNAQLITKVYFPRLIIPAAAVGGRAVDFAVAFVMLAVLMVFYRVTPTWNILLLPALIVPLMLLSIGCGMILSALNVKYRDVGIVTPVIMQLWMFVSPVVYPASLVPGKYRLLYALNPLVGIIEGFRAALFGRPFDWAAIAVSTLISGILFTVSIYIFSRLEKEFADVI